MVTANKLFIQIDNNRIELTGEAKEQFLAERKVEADSQKQREAQLQAKQNARKSALLKLADVAGLTAEEAAILLS